MHVAKGGLREAAIRSVAYIGMAGPGVDERAFNVLRQLRDEHDGLTLDEFKRVFREQFFTLMLDRDGALAAIPTTAAIPATATGQQALAAIRQVVTAAGEINGERAERLARIENLFRSAKSDAPIKRKTP